MRCANCAQTIERALAKLPGVAAALADRPALPWLMLALALPVLAYTGRPHFVGAARALRGGRANMDVLVALGAGVAFAASAPVVIAGAVGHHLYFETAAAIVTLVAL